MESIDAKLKLREAYIRSLINGDHVARETETVKIHELNELRMDLEFHLFNEADLHKLYQKHELYDKSVQLLFSVTTRTQDEKSRLEGHQRQALTQLVNSLRLLCGEDYALFKKHFKSQMKTIFTNQVLGNAGKKGQLFFVTDQIEDKNCIVQNLAQGDRIWVQEFLIYELRVLPSELLGHYQRERQQDTRRCFE